MTQDLYPIAVEKLDGSATTMKTYQGQVLLVVNVASKCGLTPQYEGLEQLYKTYRDQGFAVLGFPANNFREQEPGSNEDIQQFCTSVYGVTFPMHSKIQVTGADKHPLYQHLTQAVPTTENRSTMEDRLKSYGIATTQPPEVLWNFEKFLVNRQGQVVRRFAPDTPPQSEEIKAAIEAELAR